MTPRHLGSLHPDRLSSGEDADGLLLGRRTYELFAGYWPAAPEEIPLIE